MGHQASKPSAKPSAKASNAASKTRAPADSLNADTLDVICAFCDEQTLVSNFAHASKTVASAVDVHAAARARRYWTTSAELERRGVRLGTAFLARRSRPPRKAADGSSTCGSSIPLSSRTLTAAEREGADWDEYTRSELPLPGRVLVVDVIVRTAPAEYAGPSQTVMPVGMCLDDLAADGTVIGRRSVLLDAMPSDDAVHFAPLRIAEGLEPSSFWNDNDISESGQDRPDHYWLAEVANIVGGHQFVCRFPAFSGDPSVGSCTSVNHRFAADCLKYGIIDAYRPSQLPENHRYVSVRVDLMRLSDGKSMCLGEHDVGVQWHSHWAGQQQQGFSSDEDEWEVEEEHIQLTPADSFLYEESILPRPLADNHLNDVLACQNFVLAEYPQEAPGALDLVGVSIGFSCADHDDGQNTHFSFRGHGNTPAGMVKSLLTLDQWT